MLYSSTRGGTPAVSSAQAVVDGLAPDGGLYVMAPDALPKLDWREEYLSACVNIGRRVQVLSPGAAECPEGIAEGLGPDAELLVRLDDGSLLSVAAGEVSLRDAEGNE